MAHTPAQLPLDLAQRPALARDDFLVSPANAEAVAWIDRWPDWPPPGVVLAGPPGCGKTHLAHVWRRAAAAEVFVTTVGEGAAALVVEGADQVPERGLLTLFNTARARGIWLLLTAPSAPALWPTKLPDLRSRLGTMPVAQIQPPDDALLAAVLVKHFNDRQIAVAPDVIAFLAARLERSFEAARRAAAALDTAALAQQRPLTVPLARQVLAALSS